MHNDISILKRVSYDLILARNPYAHEHSIAAYGSRPIVVVAVESSRVGTAESDTYMCARIMS